MRLEEYNGSGVLACYDPSSEGSVKYMEASTNTMVVQVDKAVLSVGGEKYEYSITGDIPFNENDIIYINQKGFCRLVFSYGEYSQTLIVTNKCNSNCIMCPYTSSFRRSIPDTEEKFLIQQVDYLPAATRHLVITGGEPTLKDDVFFDVMKRIYDRFEDIHCLLLSNGRSFSIERIIAKANSIFNRNMIVAIPIHGATAKLHDSITRARGSFEQTIKGIKNLINCNISVELRVVVFKKNLNDMTDIARLIINEFPHVDIVNYMAAEMCGNAVINSLDVWVNYSDAFHSCETAIDELISAGIDVGIYNFPLCSVPRKYWGLYKKSISGYKVRYGQVCDRCCEKTICGGVFASSLKYAEDGMKPYMEIG